MCALDHQHEAIVPEEPALSIRPRQAAAQEQSRSWRRVTEPGQVGRDWIMAPLIWTLIINVSASVHTGNVRLHLGLGMI